METIDFKEDCRHYIDLLQENINRMASHSASCKTWLISIVSVLLAVQLAMNYTTGILIIAIVPIVLFFFLDSYYLGLEKRFIKLEDQLIDRIKQKKNYQDYMYILNPRKIGKDFKYTIKGMKSYSTWPFYGVLLFFVIALFLYNQFFNV